MLFFWARVTSLVGDNVVHVALAFAVLDLTESAADLGFVLAARTVTMLVFLLAGGVWADRVPRHALMIVWTSLESRPRQRSPRCSSRALPSYGR